MDDRTELNLQKTPEKTPRRANLKIILPIITLVIGLIAGLALNPHTSFGKANTWSSGGVVATFDKDTYTLTFTGSGTIDHNEDWVNIGANQPYVQRIVIEPGIFAIGACEFNQYKYPNLREVVINADLNYIGDCAFSGCGNLEKIVFNGDCRTICSLAFFQCYSLDEVQLPTGIEQVYNDAFSRCPCEAQMLAAGIIQPRSFGNSAKNTVDYATSADPSTYGVEFRLPAF